MKVGILLFLLFGVAWGHMAVYVPSMWGSEPNHPNSNWAVIPLQDMTFEQWWMHGPRSLNDPPPTNAITQIPAGGILDFEIVSNKAFSSMSQRGSVWVKEGSTNRSIPNPWRNDMGNAQNIHAPARKDVAGCAIGIAYKSNVNDVEPEDFVIVSVVHDCIARQLQAFDFPALPACPNGKCICSWFWVHASAGGDDQMYMNPFQCNIQNPTNYQIGKPTAPIRCDGEPQCFHTPSWGNRTTTCSTVLQPMYWKNLERNNIFSPGHCAPHYNASFGYLDGAQHQIFTNMPALPAKAIGDTLDSGKYISSSEGTYLLSPCLRTRLVVQGDGNVVMYNMTAGRVHWASGTNGKGVGPYRLYLQGDGNLVLRDSESTAIWNTFTNGKGVGPYKLKLRDMRSLTLVDRDGATWWSATTRD